MGVPEHVPIAVALDFQEHPDKWRSALRQRLDASEPERLSSEVGVDPADFDVRAPTTTPTALA
jgi:hypothetical protein